MEIKEFKVFPVVPYSTAIAALCAAIAMASRVSQNLKSVTLETNRNHALKIVANHMISESCWIIQSNDSLKIGDEIALDGMGKGTSPTSCVINGNGQFGFVAYHNNKLQTVYVFTEKEVAAKRSEIKEKNNDIKKN